MTPAPVRLRRRELRSASPGSPFIELPRHHFTGRKGALRSGSRSPVLDTALGDGRACEVISPQSWPQRCQTCARRRSASGIPSCAPSVRSGTSSHHSFGGRSLRR